VKKREVLKFNLDILIQFSYAKITNAIEFLREFNRSQFVLNYQKREQRKESQESKNCKTRSVKWLEVLKRENTYYISLLGELQC